MSYGTPIETGAPEYVARIKTPLVVGDYDLYIECKVSVDNPGGTGVAEAFQAFIDHVVSNTDYTLPYAGLATRTRTYTETITPTE